MGTIATEARLREIVGSPSPLIAAKVTDRLNGRATIVDDPELLAASAVERRTPKLGVLVSIEEAFTHCPKALIRSDLWNPERHADASELPTSGAILRAVADADLDAETYDRERDARYARREGLY